MTGLYEYRHGCNFSHGDLKRQFFEQSYPVKLRQAGYFTGFAGKIGFLIEDEEFTAFEREFDVWAGGRGKRTMRQRRTKVSRSMPTSIRTARGLMARGHRIS